MRAPFDVPRRIRLKACFSQLGLLRQWDCQASKYSSHKEAVDFKQVAGQRLLPHRRQPARFHRGDRATHLCCGAGVHGLRGFRLPSMSWKVSVCG